MLQLKLFGPSEVRGPHLKDSPLDTKLRGLLAYLAFARPEGETRDRLTAVLWGSRFQEQADQSFRQGLARLRKALGPDSIRASSAVEPSRLARPQPSLSVWSGLAIGDVATT